jgi:hypothetical protein
MFAQSLNANSREPVFTVVQPNPANVIHNGQISTGGLLGSSDRSLLDFMEVAVGPDGLANIIFADNAGQGTRAEYTRQISGPLAKATPTFPTCLPIPVPTSVVSRKVHGTAGTFDINLPLIGTRGVEDRGTGSTNDYTLVFTFPNNLTSVAGATVSAHDPASGTGTVCGTSGPSGNQYTVQLCGVSTAQYITVTLTNVVDTAGNSGNVVGPQMGVLVGDVTANGVVSNTDVSSVKTQVAAPVTASNFRNDVNFNGVISNTDVSVTKAQVGTTLPSTP